MRNLTQKINNMLQIGTICISEPMMPSEYEMARHSAFIRECNARRMKYMIELGYAHIGQNYSEEEWQNFKKWRVDKSRSNST